MEALKMAPERMHMRAPVNHRKVGHATDLFWAPQECRCSLWHGLVPIHLWPPNLCNHTG